MSKKIIFITEGGPKIGMGHLMRCVAVAEYARGAGYTPFFVVNNEKSVLNILKKFRLTHAKVKNIEQAGSGIKNENVLIDSKKDLSDLIKRLRKNCCNVTLMDNDTAAVKQADSVIYPIEHYDDNKFKKLQIKGKLYYGAKYFPLRKELLKVKMKPESRRKKILISFGGVDPNNLTRKVIKSLKVPENIKLKVLIGPAFNKSSVKAIRSLAKGNMSIELFDSSSKITDVLKDVSFCFTALGVSIYEFNYLGIPVLLLYNYTGDKKDAAILDERGIVQNIGYHKQASLKKINEVFAATLKKRRPLKKSVDCLGASRVCRIVIGENQNV